MKLSWLLLTPTVNIVGFEHQAKDDAERQLVQKMIADFTAASWFSFGAASQLHSDRNRHQLRFNGRAHH